MFNQGSSPSHGSEVAGDRPVPGRSLGRPGTRRLLSQVAACLSITVVVAGVVRASGDRASAKAPTAAADSTAKPRFDVLIHRPAGPPKVATGLTNFQGQTVMVSCSACHTTTKPNLETHRAEDLDQFHQGLKYAHGNLTCLSCHNSQDYETLRLADSRKLEFTDSMALCSQCHGPQRRDYDAGLHGGMNGHWDLTRGGRTRNTCIDCHDPHSPAFPVVMPVLPPRDRVSVRAKHGDDPAVAGQGVEVIPAGGRGKGKDGDDVEVVPTRGKGA